jgi:hypothetical protein
MRKQPDQSAVDSLASTAVGRVRSHGGLGTLTDLELAMNPLLNTWKCWNSVLSTVLNCRRNAVEGSLEVSADPQTLKCPLCRWTPCVQKQNDYDHRSMRWRSAHEAVVCQRERRRSLTAEEFDGDHETKPQARQCGLFADEENADWQRHLMGRQAE